MHPMFLAAVYIAALYLVVFLICYIPRRGMVFDFDPAGKYGEFEPHTKRYQDLARLVLTLATASIAFLINFLVNLKSDTRTSYSSRLEAASPWVISFLCLSSLGLLFFLLLENVFYEDYVHSKYTKDPNKSRETYTGFKYALNLSFGWTGLASFFVAYAVLALRMF